MDVELSLCTVLVIEMRGLLKTVWSQVAQKDSQEIQGHNSQVHHRKQHCTDCRAITRKYFI